ncbi:MAG: hypothetical protein Q7J27_02240, partial [Syntrophales bacterium]|nr:hypothetical protein [Syntrophales bacterium]
VHNHAAADILTLRYRYLLTIRTFVGYWVPRQILKSGSRISRKGKHWLRLLRRVLKKSQQHL